MIDSLFGLMDILKQKRRFVIVCFVVALDFWLLSLLAQTMQAHRASITARIQSPYTSQTSPMPYDDSNAVADSLSQIPDAVGRAANTVEVAILRGTVAASTGLISVERGAGNAAKYTGHGIGMAAIFTLHATGKVLGFVGWITAYPFVLAGHGIGHVFGFFSGLTHKSLASVIQPHDHTPVPVITQMRAQQAALIQSGTLDVLPTTAIGNGGACDNGAGNGGYPMGWCNAPMDSVQTVSYTGDHINRECTSYAYWYFTAVEGHASFHVTGNAKRWAATSNYPTHAAPAVGAIAVEIAGAYGHVAIVQALPGQVYAGRAVPAGYVLVSEMNYDWNGHFRYSYSPLGKFSAYIYP
ncbi:MAG TPA: CHAP domain-containing protein [Candidatus Saccharimonadales bacterium]|nr:CHAP domain-containing protein [Candidatus Saccharimonadales bacterium]